LGWRVVERGQQDRCRQTELLQQQLMRALSAYDASVILHSYQRDAAAHAHDVVVFSSAALVSDPLAYVVTKQSGSPRPAGYLPTARFSYRCPQHDAARGLAPADGLPFGDPYPWVDAPTYWQAADEFGSWLRKRSVRPDSAAYWRRGFSLLFGKHAPRYDPEGWRWNVEDRYGRRNQERPQLLYLSFALTQAIQAYGDPLLAPDERHLLSELSDHVKHALADGP
jgi:hypothetical protein